MISCLMVFQNSNQPLVIKLVCLFRYKEIFGIIHGPASDEPLTDYAYNQILALVREIYQQVGGIADHEENFDFERDPTEDELPR